MSREDSNADAGRGALRDHLPAVPAPRELEARVRTSLEARGLVRQPPIIERSAAPNALTWLRRTGLVAAGALLGFIGSGAVRRGSDRPADIDARGRYVLLLYGDAPDDTGAVHAAREREYGRWASSLTGARWVGGHELAEVVDRIGPGPSAREATPNDARLAGYFVIEAPSRERAAAVARTCPHLKYGGRVVVMAVAG